MKIVLWDWICFLFGRRRAIERLAATPGCWRFGLVLVLCAGIAREYDQVFLLHAPVMFLVPLIASLILAGIYFLLLLICRLQEPKSAFPAFIGLFWLTAPLAWFYALPFERLCDPVTAVWANTITLCIVAAWRVLLFARVLAVLNGQRMLPYLAWTFFGGSIAILVSSFFLQLSLVPMMGGLQALTPAEETIQSIADFAFSAAIVAFFLSIPLLVIGFKLRRPVQQWPAAEQAGPFPKLAALSLLVFWSILLAMGQADFWRLQHCRGLIAVQRYDAALAYVNDLQPMDFPPATGPFQHSMDVTLDLIDATDDTLEPWIRRALADRVEWLWLRYPDKWLSEEEVNRLGRLPETQRWLEAQASEIAGRRAKYQVLEIPAPSSNTEQLPDR